MKKQGSQWRCILSLASAALVLAACGGGGGGGGGGPVAPAGYTGLTSQAVLTNANVLTLVSGAWGGGAASSVAGVVPLANQANIQTPVGMLEFTSRLKNLVLQTRSTGRAVVQPAVAVPIDPLLGSCGGSASFTLDVNEVSETFSGQINFDNYCTLGTPNSVVSGLLAFSGQVNPANGSLGLLQMVFNPLTLSDAISNPTFSRTITEGSASFTFAGNGLSEVDTLNYVMRDNLQPKTYWIDNYVMPITYGVVSDEIGLTGRYYDSDFGYVDISTLSPLLISVEPMPNGGVLLFSGNTSQARLSFNPDQSNLLELDGNNDGSYETSIQNPL